MPKFGYSFEQYDPVVHARASGREINMSPKAAREVCNTIKGKKLSSAISLLEDVILLNKSIPFRRHKKEVAHRRSTDKFHAGRYPVKVAKHISLILNEVESNADFKGLDVSNLRIIHAAAHRGRTIPGYIPRAMGRSSPMNHELVHIEIIAGWLIDGKISNYND